MISRRCFALAGALVSVLLYLFTGVSQAFEGTHQERQNYQAALSDLERGRTVEFQQKLQQLGDYPLVAYLEYRSIRRNFSRTTPEQILEFRATHRPSHIGERLFSEWLAYLRRRGDWNNLAKYYEPQSSAEMQCAYMRALYNAGQQDKAFDEAPKLWVVNRSQHKECDPIFKVWLARKLYSQTHVWDRLGLVYAAGQRGLANYLRRFVAQDDQAMAEELDRVHLRPSRLSNTSRYSRDRLGTRRVVMHGLKRMVPGNPSSAVSLWQHYRTQLSFTEEERHRVEDSLLKELARIDQTNLLAEPHDLPQSQDARVVREVTLSLMRQGAWDAVFDRLLETEPEALSVDAWRYWLWLSAINHPTLAPEDLRVAEEAAEALSKERGYYGFMMAMRLGVEPSYSHHPIRLGEQGLTRLQALPAASRVVELYAIGQESSARQELSHVVTRLAPSDARLLLKRVFDMGWISDAMFHAMRGGAQDDLDLRFPLAFEHLFRQAASRTSLSLPLLLGLSRQESLFRVNARSSAGARGLMQLMPATAQEVARIIGRSRPGTSDLYQPKLNIELGSNYLAKRLSEFNDNRALAAAAYNGGATNVKKWLAAYGEQPLDLFIESIRFRETREYVKLVLSFSAVYAWKLGFEAPFLNDSELAFGPGLVQEGTAERQVQP